MTSKSIPRKSRRVATALITSGCVRARSTAVVALVDLLSALINISAIKANGRAGTAIALLTIVWQLPIPRLACTRVATIDVGANLVATCGCGSGQRLMK